MREERGPDPRPACLAAVGRTGGQLHAVLLKHRPRLLHARRWRAFLIAATSRSVSWLDRRTLLCLCDGAARLLLGGSVRLRLEPRFSWSPKLLTDPQLVANGYVQEVEAADGSAFRLVGAPVQFDERPAPLRRAPEPGEHTEEVLLELGLSWDEIAAHKEGGAIS